MPPYHDYIFSYLLPASPLCLLIMIIYSPILSPQLYSLSPSGDGTEVWAPPSDFERQTTKYWVRPEDVTRLTTAILRHLPVLIMNRKGYGSTPDLLGDDFSAQVVRCISTLDAIADRIYLVSDDT